MSDRGILIALFATLFACASWTISVACRVPVESIEEIGTIEGPGLMIADASTERD